MKYIDKNGWAWWVDTLAGIPTEYGIFLGPPDLTGLPLQHDMHLKFREALVDAQVYNAETLMGQRGKVLGILKELNLPKTVLRHLTHIYQVEYYGEKEDG